MKFRVTTASLADGKPCKKAKLIKDKYWEIEINSAKDLIKLVAEVGDVIVSDPYSGIPGLFDIIIYDDYME